MRKIKMIGGSIAVINSVVFDGIDSDEISKIFKDLSNQNDRNAVIVATSIIDDILSSKIRSQAKLGTPKDLNSLFSDSGPFGSMYSKVEWLYCIGELHDFIRKDINIIRKIRNDAAHIWRSFDLNNEKYLKAMEKTSAYNLVSTIKESIAMKEHVSSLDDIHLEAKDCFNMIASLIIVLLGKQIKKNPNAQSGKGEFFSPPPHTT
jgi:DNA-binding MltR family transcriptional regulator